MTPTEPRIDPEDISPEQFAQLVGGARDVDIADAIRDIGIERTLDRIFRGFPERFRPDRAQGVTADVQFVVVDAGQEYPYVVSIDDATCSARRGRSGDPKTTLTVGLVSFAKLITGRADGMRLVLTRKLKVGGDVLFAQRLMTFFRRPGV